MKPFVFIVVVLVLSISNGSSTRAEILNFAIGNWKPFISQNAEDGGPIPQLVKEAFKAEGIEINLHFLPWKRAKKMVKDGVYEGTFEWAKLPERVPFFHFCEPYRSEKSVLFFNKKSPLNAASVDDLTGKTLASGLGSGLPAILKPAIDQGLIKLNTTKHNSASFKMLALGRVDFIYKSLSVGKATIKRELSAEDQKNISYQTELGEFWEYRVMISKKSDPEGLICETFDRGLKKIKENGVHSKIIGSIQR